ncbi:MAG: DUF1569 domain-containing protein [Chloracidobacterium sp.]|nr:DUF1569 domain-containing protein [Chloracidobacterium sp.]
MKTLFDKDTHAEVVERLGRLTPDATREWGKMTASQAMEHTARAMEMATKDKIEKQLLLGKLLGWMFRKEFLGEKEFRKNAPTGPDFIVKDEPDFEATRARLMEVMARLHELGEAGTDGKVHKFFGRLSGKQWGETQYKHVDHHLRQFGV